MATRSECILVVEDDAQIRSFISYTLKQEGFPCLTAGNAQGALSQLVSNQIDLMLLDLGLPDFDGMEVIKRCGNGRRCPSLWSPPGIRTMKKLPHWTTVRTII